jgi:hypothetical protein
MTVWLQDALGLDPLLARGLQLIVAFAFVVAAIYVLFAILRRRARGRTGGPRTAQRRLGLVEALNVDDTRRLVLVRRDQVEHLLLIGGPSDVVVETAITRTAARPASGPAPRPSAAAEGAATLEPEPPAVAAAPSAATEPPAPPPSLPPPAAVMPARPAAALELRPVRPSAPAVDPVAAPRPTAREISPPRLDPDPAARPTDDIIRPERR